MKNKSSSYMRWGIAGGVLVIAVLGILGATMGKSAGGRNGGIQSVDIVRRGPLTVSVSVTGTIRSRQQEIIKSEVEGANTILYLVPEGSRVKKGDLLVELDTSKLQDSKVSQQIVVQNAEAAKINAEETLAVTVSQGKSDVAKAELDAEFAKQDLKKYTDGDLPKALVDAQNKIVLARASLKQAQETKEWSEKLFAENFLSKTEYEKDQLAYQRAQLDCESAEADMVLLETYTKPRKLAELNAAIEQTGMALEREKRKAAAAKVQAEASLRAKTLEYERQKDLLDKTLLMLEKAKMYAPTDGLVVYASTGGGGRGFRGDREPLAEGQTVREREEIIYLPTADSVMAEVKVHESSLDKVKMGLPVRINVDAVPGKVYTGRVAKIAPLPDAQSYWENPDLKVYKTEIWIDGDGSDLRTGMTCRAEIVVDQYSDALYVPIQCVVRVNGKPTVYVPGPDGMVAKNVEVGLDNNRMIRILSGLNEGDKIILSPPLADAAAVEDQKMEFPPMSPQTQPAMGMPGNGMPRNGEGRRTFGEGRTGFGPGGTGPGGPGMPGSGEGRRQMGPGADGTGQGGAGNADGRPRRFGNMTPEQMEERRKQFEAMTPEERQKAMEQFRQRRQQSGEGGAGGGEGAGGPGGRTGGRGGDAAGRGAGGPPR